MRQILRESKKYGWGSFFIKKCLKFVNNYLIAFNYLNTLKTTFTLNLYLPQKPMCPFTYVFKNKIKICVKPISKFLNGKNRVNRGVLSTEI